MPPNLIWSCWGIESGLDLDFSVDGLRKDWKFWLAVSIVVVVCGSIPGVALWNQHLWHKEYDNARKQGTDEILQYAYWQAVNSIDTIDFAKYQFVSPEQAKRDSARYAKECHKFVKNTGVNYLILNGKMHENRLLGLSFATPGYSLRKGAIYKQRDFQVPLKNYQRAVQHLAVQRKIPQKG